MIGNPNSQIHRQEKNEYTGHSQVALTIGTTILVLEL